MSANSGLAAPPKLDGVATCGRHTLPSPRPFDTLFYVMVPFLGGLFDAATMAIIFQRGARGDAPDAWRLAVSVVAAGLAAHACCAFDSLKVRVGLCVVCCWMSVTCVRVGGSAKREARRLRQVEEASETHP